MVRFKEYLGDSVYVELDEYGRIKFYLDNGLGPKNVIVMEDFVLDAFERWMQDVAERLKEETNRRVADMPSVPR